MLPYLRRYVGTGVEDVLRVQSSTDEARVRFSSNAGPDAGGGFTVGAVDAGAAFAVQRVASDGASSNVALAVRRGGAGVGVDKPAAARLQPHTIAGALKG